MTELKYQDADLDNLEYIKLVYTDMDEEVHEIKTEVNYLSDNYISVYIKRVAKDNDEEEDVDIECPQNIHIKFVIDNAMYTAETELTEIRVKGSRKYFKVRAPEILELQQNRKYYRINLKRLCMLVGTNEENSSTVYISRSINLSAGGVLINRLETMESDEFTTLEPENYERYNLILVLEVDKVLKLPARYVRQEEGKHSYRYAFEFDGADEDCIDFISKYVIRKQLEMLRNQRKLRERRSR